MLGDKSKSLRTGDMGTRTDDCRPKPCRLTDRQTGEKGMYTNKHIRARSKAA